MTNKRVVLSSDHAAIEMRLQIADHMTAKGWEVVDIGPQAGESADYPKQGDAAAQRVALGDCAFGIILCGTGQGIMMAANKVKGIRCGVCSDVFSARMTREHNDANMIAMGARVIDGVKAIEIVDAFLETSFGGGRHARRVDMLKALDA